MWRFTILKEMRDLDRSDTVGLPMTLKQNEEESVHVRDGTRVKVQQLIDQGGIQSFDLAVLHKWDAPVAKSGGGALDASHPRDRTDSKHVERGAAAVQILSLLCFPLRATQSDVQERPSRSIEVGIRGKWGSSEMRAWSSSTIRSSERWSTQSYTYGRKSSAGARASHIR